MNDRELVETANMLIGQIQKELPGQTAIMLVVQWTASGQTTVSAAGDFEALASEAPLKVADWARRIHGHWRRR
jgi:3-deoxy-D-manno-octulosonic-acid transferase